jgi:hypothetical protein
MLGIEPKSLRYLGIIALAICLVVFLKTTNSDQWFSSLSGNLFAELFGIVITVAVIDRILERNRQRDKQRYKQIALRQLRKPLKNHIKLLFSMFKASSDSSPKNKFSNIRDLFDDNYFEQIVFLDLSMPAPTKPRRQWIKYISDDFKLFKEALNRTLGIYAIYFDSETIDLIEQLSASQFTFVCSHLLSLKQTADEEEIKLEGSNFFLANINHAKEYTAALVRLIDIYNHLTENDDQKIAITDEMWADNKPPMFGESRSKTAESAAIKELLRVYSMKNKT